MCMRDEYNFTGKVGIRGKYAAQLRNGYTVVIHHADGTTTSERHLPATMIALDPDVQAFFSDAHAVNHALRAIISVFANRCQQPHRRQRVLTIRPV